MDVQKESRSFYIKHKEQIGFNAAKFTPSVIANKKQFDDVELRDYFKDHTLRECAEKYGCTEITIKRKLRLLGIDTSVHNHTPLAYSKYTKKYKLSDDDLKRLFTDDNLDSKTIAESIDPPVHYNIIRKHLRRLKLKKTQQQVAKSMAARHRRKHGIGHPSQRPDVLAKTRRSMARVNYTACSGTTFNFRSLTELAFALLLDYNKLEWYYEEANVQYVDMLTGKFRSYSIDFTTVNGEIVEWIEVKPANKMIPDDKRIYATRRAEEAGIIYRGITEQERTKMWQLINDDYRLDSIEILHPTPAINAKQISYLFKSRDDAEAFVLEGWHKFAIKKYKGSICVLILRRNKDL